MTDQPTGGQDPQFSAGPPPQGQSQGYVPTSDEKTMAILAHAGQILFSFVAPLIIFLIKGNESSYVRAHSVEALNFSITIAIGYVVASVLSVVIIGIFLFPLLWIATIICSILGAMRANEGGFYRYPATLRLVK